MANVNFTNDFRKEKKIIRVFTIIQAIGYVLGTLLFLFSAPRGLVMLIAFLVVMTTVVILLLLHKQYMAQPVVQQKQPFLKENAELDKQLNKYQTILSGEEKERAKIRQDEKSASKKRRSEHDADMAKYKAQANSLGKR